MSEWAGDRHSREVISKEQILYHVSAINGILSQYSKDSDLQDDLKNTEVQNAIKHWTGEKRLPAEEAMRFEDNYRIMAVMRKVQRLQQACKLIGLGTPLDHITQKKDSLSPEIVSGLLSASEKMNKAKSPTSKASDSNAVTKSASAQVNSRPSKQQTSTKLGDNKVPTASSVQSIKSEGNLKSEPQASTANNVRSDTTSYAIVAFVAVAAILIYYLNNYI